MKVWKSEIAREEPIVVPKGTKILTVRPQDSSFGKGVMAWGLVPDDHESAGSEEVEFILAGTGHEFELQDGFSYLNSFEHVSGTQWHVFIRYAV